MNPVRPWYDIYVLIIKRTDKFYINRARLNEMKGGLTG